MAPNALVSKLVKYKLRILYICANLSLKNVILKLPTHDYICYRSGASITNSIVSDVSDNLPKTS